MCPVKNDWTLQIEKDKTDIDLSLTDEEVQSLSKGKFKKLLKEKINVAALNFLNAKAESHTKSLPLIKRQLKCENYIKDNRFSVEEVQLLFMLRSRQFPVKSNFRNKYRNSNFLCDLCTLELCNEEHLTRCVVLKKFIPELNNDPRPNYMDIFSSVTDQLKIVKIFGKIKRQREILFEALSIS